MHKLRRRLLPPSTFRKRLTVVAVALGVTAVPAGALAATDAVPGDPFKLGQDNNIASATTTLSGKGQNSEGLLKLRKEGGPNAGVGAVLKVVNEGQGISRGIDVKVAPGRPPITVNPDAGKASGLNADRLDGRDEEDFLPTRLYGSGTPNLVQGGGSGDTVLLTALSGLECDEGDIALNAGYRALDPADDIKEGKASDLLAMEPFAGSYTIEFVDNGLPSRYRANIVCMDNARPFR